MLDILYIFLFLNKKEETAPTSRSDSRVYLFFCSDELSCTVAVDVHYALIVYLTSSKLSQFAGFIVVKHPQQHKSLYISLGWFNLWETTGTLPSLTGNFRLCMCKLQHRNN